jgi:hypothetical protein
VDIFMTLPPFDLLPLFRQQERSAETQVKAPQLTDGVQGIEEAIESSFLTADEAYAIEASGLYSACSVENLRMSRRVSSLIMNERGELQIDILQAILNCLKHKKRFLLTLFSEERNVRISHIIAQMEFLAQSIEAQKIIKRISRPYANKLAERAILDTLELHLSPLTLILVVRFLQRCLQCCGRAWDRVLPQLPQLCSMRSRRSPFLQILKS